jgi:hypothetical protein
LPTGAAELAAQPNIVQAVRVILDTPDDKIDFAREKLRLDKLVDPTTDIDAGVRQVNAMAQTIRAMAGSNASDNLRLEMVRRYIYDPGPWNAYHPFHYDMSDPLGEKPANRLLSTYLRTHLGNCVSMPVLFAALAQRLGLRVTLSIAPHHMFVKYYDKPDGMVVNIEATNGGRPARDAWYRQTSSMTDAAVGNGLYLKTLSKTEALAVLATGVIDAQFERGDFQAGWDVAEAIKPFYPNNLGVLLAPAAAGIGLVQVEFRAKYHKRANIPPECLGRLAFLERSVSNALNGAYALGWRETDGDISAPSIQTQAAAQ